MKFIPQFRQVAVNISISLQKKINPPIKSIAQQNSTKKETDGTSPASLRKTPTHYKEPVKVSSETSSEQVLRLCETITLKEPVKHILPEKHLFKNTQRLNDESTLKTIKTEILNLIQ